MSKNALCSHGTEAKTILCGLVCSEDALMTGSLSAFITCGSEMELPLYGSTQNELHFTKI